MNSTANAQGMPCAYASPPNPPWVQTVLHLYTKSIPTLLQSKAVDVQQPEQLEWSFNPWRNSVGPVWRRPYVALIISVAVCLLFGYALTYPNIPASMLVQLEQAATDPALDQATRDKASAELATFTNQRENWRPQMAGWSAIAMALLFGMTAMLYLPIRYRLDQTGVTVFFLGAPNVRKWTYYRNFYAHDTGVHLSTMPTPSALDPFRGHYIQFNKNRDEVIAFIKSHMVLRGVPETRDK